MRERGCRFTGNLGLCWIWQHLNVLSLHIQILPFPPHPIELLGYQGAGNKQDTADRSYYSPAGNQPVMSV